MGVGLIRNGQQRWRASAQTNHVDVQTRILQLGEQVFCNGEDVSKNQNRAIQAAWQALAAEKRLNTRKLKSVDKSSLYDAYLAGWLCFEQ